MPEPTKHSKIVGGSTAGRVIACPGSVKLCQTVPPKPTSPYAEEGTLLHEIISEYLDANKSLESFIEAGVHEYFIDDKIRPAVQLLDEVDPDAAMEYAVEQEVNFGQFLPDVYGTCDLIGKIGNRTVVLDWKFGDGVKVEAEENAQLMFYAAAARLTDATKWAFEDTTEVELVIIQPPLISRWVTTHERLEKFAVELKKAVKASEKADAPLKEGKHCRWCNAKAVCPLMTGAMDRALKVDLSKVDVAKIGKALEQAELLEQFIADLRAMAHQALENGIKVPGWKLVDKRATRRWAKSEEEVVKGLVNAHNNNAEALKCEFDDADMYEWKLKSPAQMEKVVKNLKFTIPEGLVEKVSSGTTIAPEGDPRPEALLLGQQLTKALGRLS